MFMVYTDAASASTCFLCFPISRHFEVKELNKVVEWAWSSESTKLVHVQGVMKK